MSTPRSHASNAPEQARDDSPRQAREDRYVAVAVPVPLHHTLTYRAQTPAPLEPGVRVRVPMGRRQLVGVVTDADVAPPPELDPAKLRPVSQVLDRTPVLPAGLLELASFTAEYYLAPIGEVLRAMIPNSLEGWGQRKVRLSRRGVFQRPAHSEQQQIADLLLDRGAVAQQEIQDQLPEIDAPALLVEMQELGLLRFEAAADAQARYVTAYEVRANTRGEAEEKLARSAKAKAAYDWLTALERPATARQICEAAECSPAVVRRLDQLGLLRKFSEIRGRSVDRHLISGVKAPEFELRPDQQAAVDALVTAVDEGTFSPFLLQGMTGSGKTEVYLRAIARCLEMERGAIVMVPEIAMVPALARALMERFGSEVAMLHSNLSKSERSEQWQRVRSGAARVVVGPRSAVFAPLGSLGVVVVDEEHDGAYKQEVSPRYHGRDLALVRARAESCVALLASATPSLESRLNAERKRYALLELTERVGLAGLPDGEVVDLRREHYAHRPGEIHFSQRLIDQIEEDLARGGQIILLRNRRGFAPLLLCRACGEDLRCDDCGVPRTLHRKEQRMLCHYCGSTLPVPRVCLSCGETALEAIGAGTERVEEQFRELFPAVEVDTLDRDVTQRTGGAAAVLERFQRGKTRVLVGTQMVAKGHHFPSVSLVAVLSADSYLGFPDFRAVERTYNLLTQVAGRAGRGDRPGRFLIQTHHPEHYAIRAALHHDDRGFAVEELRFREIFHYPPFTRMVLILVQDRSQSRARQKVEEVARAIDGHPASRGLRVVGPAAAPFEKLRGKWRFQLLLRGPSARQLRRLVHDLGLLESREITVDVDPQDLL